MYASTLPRSNWLRRASIRLAWYRHMSASSCFLFAVFTSVVWSRRKGVPLNSRVWKLVQKTRVPGLHNGENCDPTVITSVWRTDWRTGWLIAKSRCSIPAEREKKEVAMCMQCTVLWRWKCWFILRNITRIDGCLIIYRLAITFK